MIHLENVQGYGFRLKNADSQRLELKERGDDTEKFVPKIGENGNWYIYDFKNDEYIDTGVNGAGYRGERGEKGDKGDRGERGEKGDRGEKGESGHSPARGIDYWTEADKSEISANLDSKIAGKADKSTAVPKTETTAELPVYLTDALEGENVTKLLAYGTEAGSGDADGEKYKIKINACGKNLFDADSIFLSAPGWTSFYDENGVKTYKGTVPNLFSEYSGGIPLALNNKKLVFSWEARNSSKNSVTTYIKIWYPTYTENVCHIQSTEWTKYSGVSTSDVINKLTFGYTTGDTVYIRNVQIEEATEKSDYEPYSGSTVEAELDEPLLAGEYVDFLRKKHVSGTGESDITVNGRIKAPNSEVCMLWSGDTSKPKNLKIRYYQDINKVISELKNAVLAQGANV